MGQEASRDQEVLTWLARQLQPHSGVPISLQLHAGFRLAVTTGLLRAGDTLPTVRVVASALRISPNTVSKVYGILQREGFTENRAGGGTTLTPQAQLVPLQRRQALQDLAQALHRLQTLGLSADELRTQVDELLLSPAQTGVSL